MLCKNIYIFSYPVTVVVPPKMLKHLPSISILNYWVQYKIQFVHKRIKKLGLAASTISNQDLLLASIGIVLFCQTAVYCY